MPRCDSLEDALQRSFGFLIGSRTPPRLRDAMRHAVFPGGARFRPRLVLAVADACGAGGSEAAEVAAVAVEWVHCASLVHDDLPCFDNAALRRGQASVHRQYGESLAVLVGDGLIVGAFHVLARSPVLAPVLARVVGELARAVGADGGLVAGQAWEEESAIEIERYHRAKTGALFEAATCLGAIVAGVDPSPWRHLGARVGEAYQLADDIADLVSTPAHLGKPVGQDSRHARPSVALELGVDKAVARLGRLIEELGDAVPACLGAESLRRWLSGTCDALILRRFLNRPAEVAAGVSLSA